MLVFVYQLRFYYFLDLMLTLLTREKTLAKDVTPDACASWMLVNRPPFLGVFSPSSPVSGGDAKMNVRTHARPETTHDTTHTNNARTPIAGGDGGGGAYLHRALWRRSRPR